MHFPWNNINKFQETLIPCYLCTMSESCTLLIGGLTCTNCAQTLAQSLEKTGLKNVHVDFASGEAIFENPNRIDEDNIRKAVESVGYKIVDHEQNKGLSAIEKRFLLTLPFSLLLMVHMFVSREHWLNNGMIQWALCTPVFVLGLIQFGKGAWHAVRTGRGNMDLLIMLGATSALGYSIYGALSFESHSHHAHRFMFFETTSTIITLVLLGNVIEHRALTKTNESLKRLTGLQHVMARRIVTLASGQEEEESVSAQLLKPGDRIRLITGDVIPADGTVLDGDAAINESAITGESLPISVNKGDRITSGTVVEQGSITVLATQTGDKSTLSGIIQLLRDARSKKPGIQKLADTISAWFVPLVIGTALISLGVGYFIMEIPFADMLLRSIAVLVISCPCAMGLATPTAVIAGIGKAASKGILVKGGDVLQKLSETHVLALDKTGTLTTGNFSIHQFTFTQDSDESLVLNTLYTLERNSSHPVALSIVKELKNRAKPRLLYEVSETKGVGMQGQDPEGNVWKVQRSSSINPDDGNLYLDVICNQKVQLQIALSDSIRGEAKSSLLRLHSMNIKTVMVSGDRMNRCTAVANELGIPEVHAGLMPADKLDVLNQMRQSNLRVAMVGDGINDGPALAAADVGISLSGATGIAVNESDVILSGKSAIALLPDAFYIGRQTMKVIRQNLFWAFSYNLVAIPMAVAGYAEPMLAALFMAFSDVVVIGNSLRLKYITK